MRGRVALAAILAAAAAVPSVAAAVTVSPTGTYVLTSSNTRITPTSTRQALTCAVFRIIYTVTASGVISIPAGSVSASGCTHVSIGTFTVSQPVAWSGAITRSGAQTIKRISIPAGGFGITSALCSFALGGSFDLVELSNSGVISPTTPLVVLSGPVTAYSSTCSPIVWVNGLAGVLSGTHFLDRAMSVTP